MRRNPLWLLVAAALLSTACSRHAAQPPLPATTGAPASTLASTPAAAQPAPSSPASAELLPPDGAWRGYNIDDGSTSLEYFVRDGNRVIGSYNGKTFATWFITDSGIWRPNPHGSGLLRYLPALLQDNLAWKQGGGGGEAWFLLRSAPSCDQAGVACWDLTVLNHGERTLFRFAQGKGIVYVRADNLQHPGDSYTKSRFQPGDVPDPAPLRQQLLREGARLPGGTLPSVTDVTPAAFEQAVKEAAKESGRPVREIDLNGDGQPERLEGKLGEWQTTPLYLFSANGEPVNAFYNEARNFQDGQRHRLQLITLPGSDRPTLLYEYGKPDTWHRIALMWMQGDSLVSASGWHPKLYEAIGAGVKIESDGTVVITNNPRDMAGYTWVRRFRVERGTNGGTPYAAKLIDQTFTPGAYPDTPADVLTAAFIAAWYGLDADLERYVPDPAVRAAVQDAANKAGKPGYEPHPAQVGKVTWTTSGTPPQLFPRIAPASPDRDGVYDFLVGVQEYEGGSHVVGRVSFGRAGDGRRIVQTLAVTKSGWSY